MRSMSCISFNMLERLLLTVNKYLIFNINFPFQRLSRKLVFESISKEVIFDADGFSEMIKYLTETGKNFKRNRLFLKKFTCVLDSF